MIAGSTAVNASMSDGHEQVSLSPLRLCSSPTVLLTHTQHQSVLPESRTRTPTAAGRDCIASAFDSAGPTLIPGAPPSGASISTSSSATLRLGDGLAFPIDALPSFDHAVSALSTLALEDKQYVPQDDHLTQLHNTNSRLLDSYAKNALKLAKKLPALSDKPTATMLDLHDELKLPILRSALPRFLTTVTVRVHGQFRYAIMNFALVNKNFKELVYELCYGGNASKLEGRSRYWDSKGDSQRPMLLLPGITISKYVRKIELHLELPERANSAESVQELLEMNLQLPVLFNDKAPHNRRTYWQRRFTKLTHLVLNFSVEQCFSETLRSILTGLEREAVIYLKPKELEVILRGRMHVRNDCTCLSLLEEVLASMVILRNE